MSSTSLYDNFESSSWSTTSDGFSSPDGKWKVRYLSGGSAGIVTDTETGSKCLQTVPRTTSLGSTEITTNQQYVSCHAKYSFKITQQVLSTKAGWHSIWQFLTVTQPDGTYNESVNTTTHFYFLPYVAGFSGTGFEIGKKDNDRILGQDVNIACTSSSTVFSQQILNSQSSPSINLNQWYTVEEWMIKNSSGNLTMRYQMAVGKNVDMTTATKIINKDYTDAGKYWRGCVDTNGLNCSSHCVTGTSPFFANGQKSLGLYAEACKVLWDDVYWASCTSLGEPFPGAGGDTTPPTIAITSPANGATITGSSVLVQGTAFDASGIAKVELQVNGGTWVLCDTTDNWAHWSKTVNFPSSGTYTITARATDNAGVSAFMSTDVSASSSATTTTTKQHGKSPKFASAVGVNDDFLVSV